MDARKAKSLRNNNDAESNHLASRIEEGTSLASCLTGVRSIENGLTAFSDILSESRIHQNITSKYTKIYESRKKIQNWSCHPTGIPRRAFIGRSLRVVLAKIIPFHITS